MSKKEVINPVYFMSDARSEEMQKEYQKQIRGQHETDRRETG